MKKILPFLLLIVSASTSAQTLTRTYIYFDESWTEIYDSTKATYYRIVDDRPDRKYLVTDFYASGKPFSDPLICREYDPYLMWDGPATYYHENGQKKEEGNFTYGKRDGLHHFWYSNGVKHKEIMYTFNTAKYHHFWSDKGESLLNHGKGIVEERTLKGDPYFTEIQDSLLIALFRIDEPIADTVYSLMEINPEYKGGHGSMSNVINSNIKYPEIARKNRVKGTVHISFIIDEEGKSSDYTLVKGVSKEFDEEALRVIRLLTDWKPGMHHGKPVKSRVRLPIKFR